MDMELGFTKMHGLGNDFVVLDGIAGSVSLTPEQLRAIADRRAGIGCDQILLLERSGSNGAVDFRIFNADGSEVEQCGNGARCAAAYLRDRGYTKEDLVTLRTAAGLLHVQAREGGTYRVEMGVPEFEPAKIPLTAPRREKAYTGEVDGRNVEFAALALGNPHAVISVDDVSAADVNGIGKAFQKSGLFPRGVNVGFMQVLNPGRMKLRVFERGVGETLACGSGACAAAIAGRQGAGLDENVIVELPGGALNINWKGEGEPVWMTGPAVTVFEGRISL